MRIGDRQAVEKTILQGDSFVASTLQCSPALPRILSISIIIGEAKHPDALLQFGLEHRRIAEAKQPGSIREKATWTRTLDDRRLTIR